MDDDRILVTFAGRLLGTADGWDEATGNMDSQFYDFLPTEGVSVPAGPFLVLNGGNEGFLEILSETGELEKKFDLVDILVSAPKVSRRA